MKINKKYSRNFLIAASAYRKCSNKELDFSEKALKEQYEYETYGGVKPNTSINGFTYGKFALDVTISEMKNDYLNGMFTKAELLDKSPFFIRKIIKKFNPITFFPYQK